MAAFLPPIAPIGAAAAAAAAGSAPLLFAQAAPKLPTPRRKKKKKKDGEEEAIGVELMEQSRRADWDTYDHSVPSCFPPLENEKLDAEPKNTPHPNPLSVVRTRTCTAYIRSQRGAAIDDADPARRLRALRGGSAALVVGSRSEPAAPGARATLDWSPLGSWPLDPGGWRPPGAGAGRPAGPSHLHTYLPDHQSHTAGAGRCAADPAGGDGGAGLYGDAARSHLRREEEQEEEVLGGGLGKRTPPTYGVLRTEYVSPAGGPLCMQVATLAAP
ncbi:hypothetical protein BDY21DRAFT_367483 [Lineolata rhizophorae]|uniref:Uncharacterized protein n=1 Tax=Lineolata rhizophorae TaxID=578093 RepID=A0A6A6NMA0_9PEZI|nr:hypothetical protein BDY21DRAFT_367483 [Lineolata rhizophorae]